MCGIAGLFAFNEIGRFSAIKLSAAVQMLEKRGPDYFRLFDDHFVHLGHTRLSIIDLDYKAHQPMSDESGNYTIVFNGEIFNFKEIRKILEEKGYAFQSQSDTEVLLKAFIEFGEKCLPMLNGFFAFSIYDKSKQSLFIARDRMGVKPLVYYMDEDKFAFASEIKALLRLGIPKDIDHASLRQYFQLNYIPAPHTIFKHIKKLEAGHYLYVQKRELTDTSYYAIPENSQPSSLSYQAAMEALGNELEAAVQRRLISDVPLGTFLSGGIDSSVVSTLAARHVTDLSTFSIGYKDEPFFDETHYAALVAKKIGSKHTVFSLSNRELYDHLYEALDYMDEPFADSSAIAMYILSKYTRKHIKVALSGDGADEVFGGYYKHYAEYRSRNPGFFGNMINQLLPLWKNIPQSRSGYLGNKARQFQKFAEGTRLSDQERYWQWASISSESQVDQLLLPQEEAAQDKEQCKHRQNELLRYLKTEDLNEVLRTDMGLVLQNDMLTKVDWMSMANGLEVRNPFLDYKVVELAFSLPSDYKVNKNMRKRILQDTYRSILPKELYNRPKKGFEVPMLKWLRTELRQVIEEDLLSDSWIREQKIFDPEEVQKLKRQLHSSNPQDSPARIWALIVFQHWWKKYEL